MSRKIITSGRINNEYPGSKQNPWEQTEYKHQVKYTDTTDVKDTIKWELLGTVPTGIKIDESGLIYGVMPILDGESYVTDKGTEEKLLIDGSNWNRIGRPKSSYYDVNIIVKCTYKILLPTPPIDDTTNNTDNNTPVRKPTPLYKIETVESNVSIRIVKNNTIDTLLFTIKYLQAGSTTMNIAGIDRNIKHILTIGKDSYDKSNIRGYLKAKGVAEDMINNLLNKRS